MAEKSRTKTQAMVMVAVMTAILAVTSQIIIPNPFGPVPFSLSIFGVAFVGSMLTPKQAMGAIGTYTLLGLVGVPVFAGMQAGPQVLVGPTGGFIIGYFLLGLGASVAAVGKMPFALRVGVTFAGLLGCYLLGLAWFVFSTGASVITGVMVCVVPFILPDLIKIILAVSLARILERQIYLRSKNA